MIKEEVIKMAGVNKESSGKRIAIVTFGCSLDSLLRLALFHSASALALGHAKSCAERNKPLI